MSSTCGGVRRRDRERETGKEEGMVGKWVREGVSGEWHNDEER